MKASRSDSLLVFLVTIGLVCVATILFTYSYGDYGGYINGSHIIIMAVAYVTLNNKFAPAAGLGAMLAAFLSEVPYYALGALIINTIEYLIVVILLRKIKHPIIKRTIPFLVSALFISVGLVLVDWLISQNVEYLLVSLLYNSFQGLVSAIVVMMFVPLFDFIKERFPKQLEVNK